MRTGRDVELLVDGEPVRLGPRPLLMGIVNVTPDSFSDGGQFLDPVAAIEQGQRLVAEGADWLDVGGESTRPGAEPVPLDEELRRVLPVLEGLADSTSVPISIDTYKPEVARRAVRAGASIVNDVTGFRDPAMIEVGADCGAACVCMHMKGTPRTMGEEARYDDVVADLLQYFEDRIERMSAAGIDRRRIVIDPGIGFAKKKQHNLDLLDRLDELLTLNRPVMLGASRKRIIGELTGRPESERLYGTIGTAVIGYVKGAAVLRVHDVGPIRDTLAVLRSVDAAGAGPANP